MATVAIENIFVDYIDATVSVKRIRVPSDLIAARNTIPIIDINRFFQHLSQSSQCNFPNFLVGVGNLVLGMH
jgi:hypothetical protein